jgi:hypothetical protein
LSVQATLSQFVLKLSWDKETLASFHFTVEQRKSPLGNIWQIGRAANHLYSFGAFEVLEQDSGVGCSAFLVQKSVLGQQSWTFWLEHGLRLCQSLLSVDYVDGFVAGLSKHGQMLVETL